VGWGAAGWGAPTGPAGWLGTAGALAVTLVLHQAALLPTPDTTHGCPGRVDIHVFVC